MKTIQREDIAQYKDYRLEPSDWHVVTQEQINQ
ncbi:MAG: MaoC family dehydratase, partial [Pseudomonadales bacterium]|nr:MaoC family dehydratase [Pseudomonadales bacterium]